MTTSSSEKMAFPACGALGLFEDLAGGIIAAATP
jgi:hypothetical protein